MRRLIGWLPAVLCLGLAGCPSADQVPVTGTVTLDGAPLTHPVVTFRPPDPQTPGLGGSAETDKDGKYAIVGARGEKGLPAGEYTVVISRRLRPDGSPADPNVPPIESDAHETLPEKYSDLKATTLRATVSK